jgi:CBS domain containing-hemolysin-like protein
MIWIIFGILLIIFLIGVSAFFSMSEMTFVSLNRAMVIDKAKKGDKRAKTLAKLLKQPDNVISAIVIGNNLVNIFASIIAGTITTIYFGNIGIGIATVVMTLLVIIFSEATPKAYGINNEKLALHVARPLFIITKLFHPLVVLVTASSNSILRAFGSPVNRKSIVTEEKIKAMMRLGEEEGTIETDERELVDEVFDFDDTRAYEVYIPKKEVAFLQQNDTVEKLIKTSIETGYSRFPVYRKNLDDIVGMVHVKDTLNIEDETVPIKNILRDILKIDPSMKVDDVLRQMKRRRTHLALLRNKKGRTRGLISLEDLMEEIFGDISDEHDNNIS